VAVALQALVLELVLAALVAVGMVTTIRLVLLAQQILVAVVAVVVVVALLEALVVLVLLSSNILRHSKWHRRLLVHQFTLYLAVFVFINSIQAEALPGPHEYLRSPQTKTRNRIRYCIWRNRNGYHRLWCFL